jgi:DsbC/DsbD-like thiol-disulfide interchange protein
LIAAEAALASGGAGAPIRLGVQFRTAPGWHVYWKNPGDAGFPPRVDLLAPPELVGKEPTIEIEYPAPRRFSLPGGLFAIGYEGEIVYPLKPRPYAPPVGARSVRVEADVDYLTCEVDCVPYRYRLALDLPIARVAAGDPDTAPLLDRTEASLPRRDGTLPGVVVRADLARSAATLTLGVEIAGVESSAVSDLFVEPQELFEIGRPVVLRNPGGVRFELPLVPRRTDLPLPKSFPLAFTAAGLVHAGAPVALEARKQVETPGSAAAAAPAWSSAGNAFPSLLVALAAALTAVAMGLWGKESASLGRGLLGFAALGLVVACLRLLSNRVTPLALAGIELALLGLGLALWLRRRMTGR